MHVQWSLVVCADADEINVIVKRAYNNHHGMGAGGMLGAPALEWEVEVVMQVLWTLPMSTMF